MFVEALHGNPLFTSLGLEKASNKANVKCWLVQATPLPYWPREPEKVNL